MPAPARDLGLQVVHFIRKTLGFAAAQPGVAVEVGTIPAGAQIVSSSGVAVTTAFNSTGTTNTMDVGYAADALSTSDPNAYATLLAIGSTIQGILAFDELTAATATPRSVDTTVTATFNGSGATAGSADVIVAYVLAR